MVIKQLLVYIQLIGGVHGLFLTFLLWRLPQKRTLSNKILGVLLLAISYLLLWGALHDSHYILKVPDLMGTGPAFALTFGPLLYFYTRAILDKDFRFSKVDSLHFIPALLFLATQIPFYLKSYAEKRELILTHFSIPHFSPISAQIPNLQIFIYLVVIMVLLHRHKKSIKQYYSYPEKVRLDWLRQFTYVFTGIWIIFVVLFFIWGIHLAGSIMAILLAVFIYVIGYKGMQQPQIFAPAAIRYEPGREITVNAEKRLKYEKSRLPKGDIEHYKQQIKQLMISEKIYRDDELTLQDLANQMDLSTHHLSQLINEYLETNFYDFVNCYRVEEVKKALLDPEKDHLTNLAIALEAGFKSKATFYTAFKKNVGMTPTRYKKNHRE